MQFIRRMLRDLVTGEDATAAVEYAVMLALIITVCVSTIATLGLNTQAVCNAVCSALGNSTAS
jgi:pilus assembly protein Flp/PilA